MSDLLTSEGQSPPQIANSSLFPIVGVGASAGGLEAFTELLKNLTPTPGLALVLIQHLDPNRSSLLTEILGRETLLPVLQATEGLRVECDHVYVIPPNTSMTIEQGLLRLCPRENIDGPFMPIDRFFRSLAKDRGRFAVCVILSGGGTDGTLGLEDIKGEDGVTFVQDDRTARQVAMPRSAIAGGYADFVLPPDQIASELVRVSRGLSLLDAQANGPQNVAETEGLLKIFSLIRVATGIDFSQYKRTTITRRVVRRMGLLGCNTLQEYLNLLLDRPTEIQALHQDFLIRVTSFFRDPETFEHLKTIVFPRLLKDRRAEMPIRIWVAGCATGEEVYSLAIALVEAMGDMATNTPVKILATDISETALEKARAGLYVDNIALDVSPDRLRRFFTKNNSHFQICKPIRDLCVFSKHNVTRDTPFANLDLISCRNLLIYLDVPLQKRVIPFFHYALRTSGHLMLGTSETVGTYSDLFEVINKESRIYRKKPTPSKVNLEFPLLENMHLRSPSFEVSEVDAMNPLQLQRNGDRLLLNRYAPPSLIIDEHRAVLQLRGKLTPYLNPASGVASLDLFKLLHEALVPQIRDAVEIARDQNIPMRCEGLQITDGDVFRTLTIEIVPLPHVGAGPRTFLVVFEAEPDSVPPVSVNLETAKKADGPNPDWQMHIFQLERQLAAAREHTQTVVEENEATNEELKAANEEILSSNEELQSTNEELQTAKEEMQSANEELVTVNDELQHRNSELGQLNDDLLNLLGGLNIPIVMVSRELRIRRFTPSAEALFNLIASDVGRRISDLRPNLELPELSKLIATVIDSLKMSEVDVQDHEGRWYSLRIRPYVTTDNKIDGAVIGLVDIDDLKRSAEEIKASRDNAEAIVETVGEPLVVLDQELRIQRTNAAFYRTFGLDPAKINGRLLSELEDWPLRDAELVTQLKAVVFENRRIRDLKIEVDFPKTGLRTVVLNAHRIFWEGSGTQMILLAIEDFTNRKQEIEQAKLLAWEQEARAEAETANRRKDEFLAMLAHELRNPLAPIRNTFYILRQRVKNDEIVGHALDMSERQIGHMARLLDDLLDVSRITVGKIQLQRELVLLQTAIARAVESCTPLIESRRHQLIISSPSAEIFLDADPARLEQILSNLITNAAKYTDVGGTISLDVTAEGKWVVIRLTDSGCGISEELLPRIFDLFTQADHSLDRAQGGLGIGLTLVKSLVELHGGTIEASSEGIGKGSAFIVRLPALGSQRQSALSSPAIPDAVAVKSRRILVVDDNADAATTLAMLLRHHGHHVTIALTGPDALKTVAAQPVDVVLLDIGLPGMNGFEVAEQIRKNLHKEDVTIIAATGYAQESDRERARQAGMNHHLVKPIDPHELQEIIAKTPVL
jgi:two-component system CheB/CheR fusion protein